MNDIKLLMQLMNLPGPSGYEQDVRRLIAKKIKPYVHTVRVDKFGNLIASEKGSEKWPRIMLAAHMDEIGLMVKEIRGTGKIKFSYLGGIEPVTLVGQRVNILTKKGMLKGIITFMELHEDLSIEETPELNDLYIDTGLNKEQLNKIGVAIGDYVIAEQEADFLGSKKIISGKALDNRVGCYILIQLAKRLKTAKNLNVEYVFTVQEEVGLYGAQTSVYELNPDWGIAVDATSSEDSEPDSLIRPIGNGPCLTLKDYELITNRCLNEHIIAIAKKRKLPLQKKVEEFGTTDATKIMLSKGGVPSTVISVPVRNLHSTIGIAHMDDINNAIELLYRFLKNPPRLCDV